MFKERIEYDNTKRLEEVTRKENFYYNQNKNKRESIPTWKNKRKNNFDPRKKHNKFHKNIGNNYKGYQSNKYKNLKPQNSAVKEPPTTFNKNTTQREPLKCWECDGTHYFKDWQVRNKFFNVHSIQEVITVGDVARSIPRICVFLENQQVDHQTSMVKIEGIIKSQPISILIDTGASLSYISPRIVELRKLVP